MNMKIRRRYGDALFRHKGLEKISQRVVIKQQVKVGVTPPQNKRMEFKWFVWQVGQGQ